MEPMEVAQAWQALVDERDSLRQTVMQMREAQRRREEAGLTLRAALEVTPDHSDGEVLEYVESLKGERNVLLEELRRVRYSILEAGVVAGPDVGTPQLVSLLVEYLSGDVDAEVVEDDGPGDPLDNVEALLERMKALEKDGTTGALSVAEFARREAVEAAVRELAAAIRLRDGAKR